MADEIITQYLIPSSNAIPTVSDPHAPVGSFLRRDVLLHPFVEKDTVTVDGQERERVIIRMLPDYMTNPYVHKFVMYMMAVATIQCSWVQKGSVLEAGDGADNDQFGYAVALASNVLAVGANNWEGASGSNIGGVYIFDWTGVSWVQRGSVLYPAAGQNGDGFGTSVALTSDASVLIVGAGNFVNSTVGFRTGGVYTFDWSGSSWVQRGSVLTAIDWGLNDYFGASVAVSDDGNILVVGASSWGGSVNTSGCVYTFDRSGSSWIQRGSVLEASDKQESDLFGSSVSLSSDGTVLAVGAQFWEGSEGVNTGGVYIYDWSGSAWVQRGSVLELNSNDFQITEEFGSSVALSSNASVLAVGASGRNSDQGDVHIYDWSGSSWVKRGTALVASDAANSDYFGASVALSSNAKSLVVGAYKWEGTLGSNRGGIYFYNWICNGCVHEQTLFHSEFTYGGNGIGNDNCAISADGKVAVFGNVFSTVNGNRVIVYRLVNNVWTLSSYLYPVFSPPLSLSDMYFGYSVAISGDGNVIFVGNPVSPLSGQFWCNVHIFRWNGTDWGAPTIITASDGTRYDRFGFSVSCDYLGNNLVVGCPSSTTTPVRSGKAYTFKYVNSAWAQEQIINGNTFSFTTNPGFGSNVQMSPGGKKIAIAAKYWSFSFSNEGLVSIYTKSSTTTWIHFEDLVSPNQKNEGYFGYSLDFSANGDTLIIAEQSSVPKGVYGIYRSAITYFFTLIGNYYDLYNTIECQDAYVSDVYGSADIAVSKDLKNLFIGSNFEPVDNKSGAGRVYKYISNSDDITVYAQDQTLTPVSTIQNNWFGSSIASSYRGCTIAVSAIGKGRFYIFSCDCQDQPENYLITYYRQTYDKTVNQYHDFIVNNQNYDVRFFGQATTRTAVSSDCFVYFWQTQTGTELGTTGFFSMEFWIGDLSDSGVGIGSGFSASSRTLTNSSIVSNYLNNNDVPIFIEAIHSTDNSKSLTFLYVLQKNDYTTSPDEFINIIGNAVYTVV